MHLVVILTEIQNQRVNGIYLSCWHNCQAFTNEERFKQDTIFCNLRKFYVKLPNNGLP